MCDVQEVEEYIPYDHFNGYRKSFLQNSTLSYDDNSPESGHRRSIPQHRRGHI